MITDDDMNAEQYSLMQNQNNTMRNQQELMLDEANRSMAKDQLDLSEELERIEHLLRGHVIEYDKEGNRVWTAPKDSDMIVLSEYGIHLILNTITWYINKNTLLSNYTEETILSKMEDFSTALADVIYMEYERIFEYPSFEDLKTKFNDRIKLKTDMRMYAGELAKIKLNKEIEQEKILKQYEGRIEAELEKIKLQVIKDKLKRFEILIRCIQDSVHSTYLRAYKGMERRTLREHFHTTESIGGFNQQKTTAWTPLNWLRSKKE
jgi:hypothetical protein